MNGNHDLRLLYPRSVTNSQRHCNVSSCGVMVVRDSRLIYIFLKGSDVLVKSVFIRKKTLTSGALRSESSSETMRSCNYSQANDNQVASVQYRLFYISWHYKTLPDHPSEWWMKSIKAWILEMNV